MQRWRVLSTTAVAVAIGTCAATVVAFAASQPREHASGALAPLPTPMTATPPAPVTARAPAPRTAAPAHPKSSARPTPRPSTSRFRPAPAPRAATSSRTPPPAPAPQPGLVRGGSLPLGYGVGSAARVITVVAPSTGSTTGTLQAWTRAPGGGWLRYGAPVAAHLGSQGLSAHPSESLSATPIGSFTLTQAFGSAANPGTPLPYFRTDQSDWWVSDASSRYYNTHYRCSSACPFDTSAGENLYRAGYVYTYAVVIDYNRFPVTPGAGSAFFLHVSDGGPTAGCVSIPEATLVTLMRWLSPGTHPRILIGLS